MQGFGAPVEWRPAAVFGLFFLWVVLTRFAGDLAAIVIVLLVGLAILFRRPLLQWYRNHFHESP